jgi:hypothetical protein
LKFDHLNYQAIMKKLIALAAILLLWPGLILHAQTLTYTYSFQKPSLSPDGGYTELILNDCINIGEEGTPLLPWFTPKIVLPPGQEITDLRIISESYYPAMEGIRIKPASRHFPISKPAPADYKPAPRSSVYESASPYPASRIAHISTQFLCGHGIGVFNICPVKYLPSENKLWTLKEITVEIKTQPTRRSSEASKFLRTSNIIRQRIGDLVTNKEMLAAYTYPKARDNEADILLITNTELLPYFEEYINFKTSTGYIVITEVTEDIYNNFPGQDDQDKIRNCIISHYENEGISYVILGGDADPPGQDDRIIPHRGFTAYDDSDIPADMYYACLDGNWNNDGDNYWGEPGEEDIFAEVAVGRLCVDNHNDIENFVHKLIFYQDSPVVADIEKAVMIGEKLDDVPTWGGDSKDEVADGSSTHGITTVGVTEQFQVSHLYDRDMRWSKVDVINQFNQVGTHLLNHLGHSNNTYNMKMNTTDINTTSFTNNGITRGYVIGYSQGCYNGAFDNRLTAPGSYTGDSFAEKITNLATAEVATIANSRYGWYSPGNTDGPSQFFDREFYDAIFGEGLTPIGVANGDSKEELIGYITGDEIGRWCAYELNLFGDPSMDIWTAAPVELAVSHAPVISLGASEFDVFTDAPFARVALLQNGVLLGRSVAGEDGKATVQLFSPLASTDTIGISIIAHNRNRYHGTINVINSQPFISFQSLELNDPLGNQDGLADYGEPVNFTIGMKNIGDMPATDVNVTISTEDTNLLITDGMESYGSFATGETKTIDLAFASTIDSLSPWHTAIIDLHATDGTNTWNSSFLVIVHAPVLRYIDFSVDDSDGNGNGRIDPGESAQINITIQNRGSSSAFDIESDLSSTCEFISIIENGILFGDLAPGQNSTRSFAISASPDCPQGTTAWFDFIAHAKGGVSADKSYRAFIGQPPVLVMDLDGNKSSGPAMVTAINDLDIGADYINGFPADLNVFQAVFVSLGTFWKNHRLTHEEGQVLADYLNAGGNLYLEGGGTWFYDYQTAVHGMFNIDGEFGTLDLSTILGKENTFTSGMSFEYSGDSLYWDKLTAIPPAELILENQDPVLGLAVAYDAVSYKTIGTSVEFGGLQDGQSPSTRQDLMRTYLEFFGLLESSVGLQETEPVSGHLTTRIFPNPSSGESTISFNLPHESDVSVMILGLNGNVLRIIANQKFAAGEHSIKWLPGGESGNPMPSGIYFYRVMTNDDIYTGKFVYLK